MSHVEAFCAEHFVRERISQKRQPRVRRLLVKLDELYAPRTLLDWTDAEMRSWTTARSAEVSPNTVRWEMMMVRPFFRWAWRAEKIDTDRFHRLLDVDPPRGATSRTTPNPYTRSEIQEFWSEVAAHFGTIGPSMLRRFERGTSRFPRVRQHGRRLQVEAIAALALHCGLRMSEIYQLGLDDLHPDNAYLPIAGKSDPTTGMVKYRQVPYADAARRRVAAWLAFRRLLRPKHPSIWMRLTWRDPAGALNKEGFEGLLPGVGRGWGLHRFRHTCATERLRNGMTIDALKEFLGHATIEQTLAYAKIIASDVRLQSEASDAGMEAALEPEECRVA